MASRAPSVFNRYAVVCRYAVASVGALCLALACLNPQNDDLPSSERSGGTPVLSPSDPVPPGNIPPPATDNNPSAPLSPEPPEPPSLQGDFPSDSQGAAPDGLTPADAGADAAASDSDTAP